MYRKWGPIGMQYYFFNTFLYLVCCGHETATMTLNQQLKPVLAILLSASPAIRFACTHTFIVIDELVRWLTAPLYLRSSQYLSAAESFLSNQHPGDGEGIADFDHINHQLDACFDKLVHMRSIFSSNIIIDRSDRSCKRRGSSQGDDGKEADGQDAPGCRISQNNDVICEASETTSTDHLLEQLQQQNHEHRELHHHQLAGNSPLIAASGKGLRIFSWKIHRLKRKKNNGDRNNKS